MDAAKWSQGFQDIGLVKPMEEMVPNSCTRGSTLERKTRPPEQLNCPRCNSTNTKFCYYNNYSLTQPRYFCKTCRRYWTDGGSLRNVPVGGGSRKNKRPTISSSSSSSSAAPTKVPDLNPTGFPQFSYQNPKPNNKGQDLNLSFPVMQENTSHGMSQYLQMSKIENNNNNNNNEHGQNYSSFSALELLKTGVVATRGLNSFIPTPDSTTTLYTTTGFPMQDYKPTLSFSMDHGLGNRAASNIHGVQENEGPGRLFFPFGEMKPISSTHHHEVDQNKGSQQGNSTGYNWNNGGGLW